MSTEVPPPATAEAKTRRGNPNLALAPRCGARTRAGCPCRAPAIRGKLRCRMHGGRSTGPRTEEGLTRLRIARTIHGHYGAEARARDRHLISLRRNWQITADAIVYLGHIPSDLLPPYCSPRPQPSRRARRAAGRGRSPCTMEARHRRGEGSQAACVSHAGRTYRCQNPMHQQHGPPPPPRHANQRQDPMHLYRICGNGFWRAQASRRPQPPAASHHQHRRPSQRRHHRQRQCRPHAQRHRREMQRQQRQRKPRHRPQLRSP